MAAAIRILNEGDAAAFLALRQRSLRDHPDLYHSTAEDWAVPVAHAADRIRRNVVIGAFADGTLVGCLVLAQQARPGGKRRHKVEIWNVYVAPEQRGGGLARLMVGRAVEEARSHGYEALVLGVAAHNERARRLYESMGFVAFGIEPRALKLPGGLYVDDCFMQLDLKSV